MPVAVDAAALLADLNPAQREAVEAVRGPVVILAGAGTGKTRVLTRRVAYAAATEVADPRRALVVTFTARAAGEMGERLRRLGVRGVTARTFHAAALDQLRYFWPRVSDRDFPGILETKARLLVPLVGRERAPFRFTPVKDVADAIEWAKIRRVDPADVAAQAAAAGRPLPLPDDVLRRIWSAYERAKERAGLIDFEDMLARTVELLETDVAAAELVRARYSWFSVDEYQDTNLLQEQLLGAWLGGRRELCVVGDPDQTIYTFTGASSGYLAEFDARYPDAKVVELRENYRSSPQIVAIGNRLASPSRSGAPRLVATAAAGPPPRMLSHADEREELAALVTTVRGLFDRSGVAPAEIAVLVRTNAQIAPIEDALTRAAIPYQVRGERFYARRDVREALTAIRSLGQGDRVRSMAATHPGSAAAAGGRGQAGSTSAGEAEAIAPDVPAGPLASGAPAEAHASAVPPGPLAPGARAEALASGAPAEAPRPAGTQQPLSALLAGRWEAELGYEPDGTPETEAARERQAMFETLLAIAAGLPSVEGALPSPTDFLAEIARREALEREGSADGVVLSTIHRAKGLEWDAVLLPAFEEGFIPHGSAAKSDAGEAEERRLAYVAVTRARRHLVISWAAWRRLGKAGREARREPSRYLSLLADRTGPGAGGARATPAPTPSRRRARPAEGAMPREADTPLVTALKAWRRERARAQGVPAYVVLDDATIGEVAASRPRTPVALGRVRGIGPKRVEQYGEEILEIVGRAD